MNQTIVLQAQQVNKILKTLLDLKREVARLTEKVEGLEPIYGSEQWWEWSDRKALEDIRAGRFVEFKNVKDLQLHLDSLKST